VPRSSRSSPGLYDRPVLLLVLAVLFWSGNFILGRAVRADVPAVALAFWRWALASAILAPIGWRRLRADLATLIGHRRVVLLLAFLGVASFNTLVYLALQSTTAVNAFLMQSLMPVLIVALSFLIFSERIVGRQVVGLALSLIGASAIVTEGRPHLLLALGAKRGDLLLLAAVLSYAAYSALLRLRPPVHPISFLLATFWLGTLMLAPFYLWESLAGHPLVPTAPALLSIAYVAVFPSILSFLFFNRGVELIGANRAGLFIHLMPLFGSVLAVLLLGESFRWFHGLGLVLILAGIALASRVFTAVRRRPARG
jgi:drug/metabolite transporter (DMT)-like permease